MTRDLLWGKPRVPGGRDLRAAHIGGSIENGVVNGSRISFNVYGSPGSHFSGSVAADGMSMSGNGTMSAYFDDDEEVALSGTWTAVKQ